MSPARGVPKSARPFPLERGEQIAEWLAEHPEVTRFAIVDDDSDMGDLDSYLFKTDFNSGLTAEIADRIIEHLSGAS